MPQTTNQLIEEAVRRYDNQFGNTGLTNRAIGFDASRQIREFLKKELKTIASKSVEVERSKIGLTLTQELDMEKMLDGWEIHWTKASNGRYVQRCIECENSEKIIEALSQKEYSDK